MNTSGNLTPNQTVSYFPFNGLLLSISSIAVAEGLTIVTANLLVILTFSISTQLRKPSYYFVINLAVADLLTGLAIVYVFAKFLDKRLKRKIQIATKLLVKHENGGLYNNNKTVEIFLSAFLGASFFSFVCISVERMHATVWPLRHRNTKPRMYIVFIMITWLSGLLLSGLTYAHIFVAIGAALSFGLILFLVLVVSYATIFIKVKRQHQLHNQSDLQRTIQKERELAKTLLLVTVTSLVTWLPLIGVGIDSTLDGIVDSMTLAWASLACGGNALCNPVIYMFRMKEYRRALKHLVCKCSRDRRVQPAVAHG